MSGIRKYQGLDSSSKLYNVWFGIKMRCFNKNNPNYKNYGGRGITICSEWKNDYNAFKEWAMENGYHETDDRSISIERLDLNGNYTPDNCVWAIPKTQMNNTRRNIYVEYDGKTKTLAQWAEYLGINYSTFMSRISRGWYMERIAKTPVQNKRR